jgi:hypothetical protein
VDDEPGRLFEAIEVADPALVAAFAEELGSLATGTALGALEGGLKLDMNGTGSRLMVLEGLVPLQPYI